MRDHDDICLDSDNVLSPLDIGIDNPLAEERVLNVRFIYRTEHANLKTIRLWVIELFEVSNRLLFLV